MKYSEDYKNMLASDEIIYNHLLQEKEDGNKLLQYFHISYPSKNIARESNTIYVATVSSEPENETHTGTEYRDLIEILVATKIRDYQRAVTVVKTVIREIIRLIKECPAFVTRPVIRNIAPEYNQDFVLTKGHIMVECLTPVEDYNTPEIFDRVCKILDGEIEVK